jgi:methylated-DNA-[protein]-cysteine S-methyltransferase
MATAYYGHLQTRFGPMLVAGDGARVVAVKFGVPAVRAASFVGELERETGGRYRFEPGPRRITPVVTQLRQYFAGRRRSFELEMDLSWIDGFRRDVLMHVHALGWGEVASYGEIAGRAGSPRAARAVGNAMRTNPIPIVIPCHRVIASGGTIGGYGGSVEVKRALLAHEGVRL